MGQINVGGVLKGGLVAGVIMTVSESILNIPVAGERMDAELKVLNLAPPGNHAIAIFMGITLALGILMVWLYAAIRPRFGPGPKTAVCAGLLVWALSYLYGSISFGVLGINSWGLITLGVSWTLVECMVAAVAGAYFYKEEA